MAEVSPTYKTRADLEKLLNDDATKSNILESKDSRAQTRDEGKIIEICINVYGGYVAFN